MSISEIITKLTDTIYTSQATDDEKAEIHSEVRDLIFALMKRDQEQD